MRTITVDKSAGWISQARRRLLDLRHESCAWGDRIGGVARVEPTVWSALGLLATGDEDDEAWRAASRWLSSLQQSDGAVGIDSTHAHPGWTTALAIIHWSARAGFASNQRRASEWLLRREGKRHESGALRGVMGHNPALTGWPWVEGTDPWLEPTALAVLALARAGLAGHKRVAQGRELINDRAIAGEGWNYGNNSVFGTRLRSQPEPTGLALLALRASGGARSPIDRKVADALRYLEGELPAIRAAASLSWGLMGLDAWGRRPRDADRWLEESAARLVDRAEASARLGLLLMAAGRWFERGDTEHDS